MLLFITGDRSLDASASRIAVATATVYHGLLPDLGIEVVTGLHAGIERGVRDNIAGVRTYGHSGDSYGDLVASFAAARDAGVTDALVIHTDPMRSTVYRAAREVWPTDDYVRIFPL